MGIGWEWAHIREDGYGDNRFCVFVCDRLFPQLSFIGADRAEFHIMQFIKLPSTSDRLAKSVSKNVKRDSILPLDLLKGTDSDVKCFLASCLRSVHVSVCLSVCLSLCLSVVRSSH